MLPSTIGRSKLCYENLPFHGNPRSVKSCNNQLLENVTLLNKPASHQNLSRKSRLHSCKALATEVQEEEILVNSFTPAVPGTFVNNKTRFFEDHRMRGYEVGIDQCASIVTISNLLQETASNHAVGMWGRTDAGFANVPAMKDLIFVMTRLQIQMNSYPKWGDLVRVETYFEEDGRVTVRRDWTMQNAITGEVYGAATSTWVTINIASRRLSKLPDEMRRRFLRFSPNSNRIAIPVEETKLRLPDVEFTREEEAGMQVHVARRSDMDMNGHINNVTYLAWSVDCVPDEVHHGHRLAEVEIDFKAECHSGDVLEAMATCLPEGTGTNGSTATGLKFLHTLRRRGQSGSTELVRARTRWVAS